MIAYGLGMPYPEVDRMLDDELIDPDVAQAAAYVATRIMAPMSDVKYEEFWGDASAMKSTVKAKKAMASVGIDEKKADKLREAVRKRGLRKIEI